MSVYIGNVFSINMLNGNATLSIKAVEKINDISHDLSFFGFTSCVGHEDTARLFSNTLGVDIPVNRISVKLKEGDFLYVGQYAGPRLQEGTTVLPDGAEIKWYLVTMHEMQ